MPKVILNATLSPLLAALICLGLNCCLAQSKDAPTKEHQLIYPADYVPLERNHQIGGQPVVQTTINGTRPAAFMLDTGSFNILSPELAQQLNLRQQPAVLDNGKAFLWKGKPVAMSRIAVVKIGNLSLYDGPFRLLKDEDFMLSPRYPDDTHFDGVLGIGILQHFAVLLDGSQHKLGFCLPGNLSLQQVNQAGLAQPYTVPMTERNSLWFIEAHLTSNGISGSEDLLLDTGSNFTEISDTTAGNLHLKISDVNQKQNAYNGNETIGVSSVDSLQIGNLTLHETSLTVAPISKLEPPLLGMDILSGYRILMDFPAKKMYLQPNPVPVPTITVGPQTTPPGQTPAPQPHP